MDKITTQFQQRLDLSVNHSDFELVKRRATMDYYEFKRMPTLTIRHSSKYGPSVLINEDPIRGNMYMPGDPFDVFDVWHQIRNADPKNGISGLHSQIQSRMPSFADAVLAVYAAFFKELLVNPPERDLFTSSKV